MSDETTPSKEFLVATRIAKAIQAKFPKHKEYVREIKTGDFSFIEIALRPINGIVADEVTTAYSMMFFSQITDANLKERALKILKDFRILMGVNPK
jgi:hypothetical protein